MGLSRNGLSIVVVASTFTLILWSIYFILFWSTQYDDSLLTQTFGRKYWPWTDEMTRGENWLVIYGLREIQSIHGVWCIGQKLDQPYNLCLFLQNVFEVYVTKWSPGSNF